jgi:hypothetical protein
MTAPARFAPTTRPPRAFSGTERRGTFSSEYDMVLRETNARGA